MSREYHGTDDFIIVGHGGGNRVDVRHFIRKADGENVTVIYLRNGSNVNHWPGYTSTGIANIIMPAQVIG